MKHLDRLVRYRMLEFTTRADPAITRRHQTEAAMHIASEHPGWIEREKPFLGYLQFRDETDMPGGARLERLEVRVTSVIPGPHGPPRGADRKTAHQQRWDYRLDHQALLPGSAERLAAERSVVQAVLDHYMAESHGAGIEGKAEPKHVGFCDRTSRHLEFYDTVNAYGQPIEPHRFDDPVQQRVKASTAKDLLRANGESELIELPTMRGITVECVTREQATRLLLGGPERRRPGSTWQRFHGRNPGSLGLMWMSAAGFDEDGTQAIIHLNRYGRDLAGRGWVYLLEKKDGAWVVIARESTWVS